MANNSRHDPIREPIYVQLMPNNSKEQIAKKLSDVHEFLCEFTDNWALDNLDVYLPWEDIEKINKIIEEIDLLTTKEKAELDRDYRKIKNRVLDHIAKYNNGWRPDWSDSTEQRYLFVIDHNEFKIFLYSLVDCQIYPDEYYMKDDNMPHEFTDEELYLFITGRRK